MPVTVRQHHFSVSSTLCNDPVTPLGQGNFAPGLLKGVQRSLPDTPLIAVIM